MFTTLARRSSRVGLALLLSTAAAAVAALPQAPAPKQPPGAADAAAFFPAEAACYVHVRVADLWDGPLGKQLRVGLAPAYGAVQASFVRHFGLQPGDIETLTVASMETPSLFGIVLPNFGRFAGGAGDSAPPKLPATENKGGDKVEPPKKLPAPAAASGPAQPPDIGQALERQPVMIATVANAKALQGARDLAAKGTKKQHQGQTYFVGGNDPEDATFFLGERAVVRGPEAVIRKGIELLGKAKVTPRLAALDKHRADHIWIDSRQFRFGMLDGGPNRPPPTEYALEPLGKSTGKQTAIRLGKETTAHVELFFAKETEAKAAVDALEDYLAMFRLFQLGGLAGELKDRLYDAADPREEEALAACLLTFERLILAVRKAAVKQAGTTLTVDIAADTDPAAIAQEVKGYLKALRGDEDAILARNFHNSRNNLKQIILALHSYHDANKRFPPWGTAGANGQPLLSWRVAILPYIEQGPLWQQFKMDEPWDGPNNKKLIAQMPKLYALPGVKTKEPGLTHYQGFVGPGAGWESDPKIKITLANITDGTANTVAVVEAAEPVPWTKPADLPFAQGKPLPKLSGAHKGKANAAFFDGSVRALPANLDPVVLSALITRNGGEAIFPKDDWK
jgi:prepilin-type processing-associated H-X9-DG protein